MGIVFISVVAAFGDEYIGVNSAMFDVSDSNRFRVANDWLPVNRDDQGVHTAMVRTQDTYGNEYEESFVFEIVDERPEPYARVECHQSTASAGATGTPVVECN